MTFVEKIVIFPHLDICNLQIQYTCKASNIAWRIQERCFVSQPKFSVPGSNLWTFRTWVVRLSFLPMSFSQIGHGIFWDQQCCTLTWRRTLLRYFDWKGHMLHLNKLSSLRISAGDLFQVPKMDISVMPWWSIALEYLNGSLCHFAIDLYESSRCFN